MPSFLYAKHSVLGQSDEHLNYLIDMQWKVVSFIWIDNEKYYGTTVPSDYAFVS